MKTCICVILQRPRNRFVICRRATDLRKGVDGLSGLIRQLSLDPFNGDVYVFVNGSRRVMKLLHWERGGFVIYYKRLVKGRFHSKIFLRTGIGFRSMRWDELVLLMEGISPKVLRRSRFRFANEESSDQENNSNNSPVKPWLSR